MKHLQRAFDGQNYWLKYVTTFLLALVLGQVIGYIPLFIMSFYFFELLEHSPLLEMVLMVIPFFVMLFFTLVLARGQHNRNLDDLINGGYKIRWEKIIWGFAVWFILSFAFLVVTVMRHPQNFEFRFDLNSFFRLIIVAILFVPIQAASEEILLRGYLAQGIAAWTKRPWLVALLPSIVFALLHSFNPEVEEFGFWMMMPIYFMFGLCFAIISILDDGIELAVGLHSGNNVFMCIFVTTEVSVIQTPALLLQKNINPWDEFWMVATISIAAVSILAFLFKLDPTVLGRKISTENKDK